MKDLIDESSGKRTDCRCPSHETFGCPFQITLMRLGPMRIVGGMATDLRAARMTGNTLTAVKDLDGHRRITHIELAMEQSVRNAVVVLFDFNVVIDVDAYLFPFGKRVRFGG